MRRKNCWEVMKCGREPNGRNEKLGICPAAMPTQYDGINNGNFGGRICWVFAGTFCGGEVQGSLATKLNNCLYCGFFRLVKEEAGKQFIMNPDNGK